MPVRSRNGKGVDSGKSLATHAPNRSKAVVSQLGRRLALAGPFGAGSVAGISVGIGVRSTTARRAVL
jgi:hypothetical protein